MCSCCLEKFDKQEILNTIEPAIDVDCLNKKTSDLFYAGEGKIGFPTALACVYILDSLGYDMKSKKAVVIGQGMLVGKPVTHILKERGVDVGIIVRDTKEEWKKNY